MATWAGTGPQGETCEHCRLFTASSYLRGACKQYVELRKAQGERRPVPITFRHAHRHADTSILIETCSPPTDRCRQWTAPAGRR